MCGRFSCSYCSKCKHRKQPPGQICTLSAPVRFYTSRRSCQSGNTFPFTADILWNVLSVLCSHLLRCSHTLQLLHQQQLLQQKILPWRSWSRSCVFHDFQIHGSSTTPSAAGLDPVCGAPVDSSPAQKRQKKFFTNNKNTYFIRDKIAFSFLMERRCTQSVFISVKWSVAGFYVPIQTN